MIMPKMDGLGVLENLRRSSDHFLPLSACRRWGRFDKKAIDGAKYYLVKPLILK